ncbi:MAG: type IV toxin-antitoxin system AbiEi family antitoxin domain-containing protein [Rhizobiaceae bacterium]|nr:type IV toxin-antitoxin system AbiEi family antitoxin domain-containing protein [Rhizobiaceae bacterium]
MTGIADRIMKRVRAKGRGRWVCTPKDFLDLGSRAAVDQALSRLAKSGDLRRVGRGLYDLPRTSGVLMRPAPVDMEKAVAALARRDSIRIMPDGIAAANQLGLTNAVPAKTSYVTDGATRDVKIGNRTVCLRHAGPRAMAWTGKSSAPVAQALRWFGPQAASDVRVATTLKRKLPDAVKKDLVRNSSSLPSWATLLAHSLVEP